MAVTAIAKQEVRKVSAGMYMVDSQTHTLVTYTVCMNGYGEWECNCGSYVYRHSCKHVAAALAVEEHAVMEREPAVQAPERGQKLGKLA